MPCNLIEFDYQSHRVWQLRSMTLAVKVMEIGFLKKNNGINQATE
ncbi:hypothetical protein HMPREF0650_1525 [Hoylesella buccalis ATCC 35310]|uniref:Uncharacterized protein n=1 Tax=Hoylesella buccalis ATCC 35310 TaxID=679190 RepID=D1W880_9BACT|nr:hypothetical protein HMPREF0650_1525 [Hoylesella buccalis ATCC 35310]